jgi:hypothetical protein
LTLSCDARLPETTGAFSIFLGQDVAFLGWEMLLRYTREDGTPAKQMDILVRWRGEQQRSKIPRRVVKSIFPHAHKRLYIPPWETLSKREIRAWTQDNIALVSLYLVQAGLISLDEDQSVQHFLLSYLSKFKGAVQVGAGSVLAEILTSYRLPEEYRAWRKYVSKTIRGLVATEKRQERSYVISDPTGTEEHLMVPAVADRLGMPTRSLYHLVKQGAVRAKEVTVEGRRYQTIPDAEIARLEQLQGQKRLRKARIAAWAEKQGIPPASARRWVERQEKKGRELKEMDEMIGRKWLEKAVRSLSQDSKA